MPEQCITFNDEAMPIARPTGTFHSQPGDRRTEWDRLCNTRPVMSEEEVLRYLQGAGDA